MILTYAQTSPLTQRWSVLPTAAPMLVRSLNCGPFLMGKYYSVHFESYFAHELVQMKSSWLLLAILVGVSALCPFHRRPSTSQSHVWMSQASFVLEPFRFRVYNRLTLR